MPSRAVLILLALILAALGFWTWRALTRDHPALWQVTNGERSAYIFGTIHAVPSGANWMSPPIARAMRRSDALILEVPGLDAERGSRAVFEALGREEGLPPLTARLDPDHRAMLAKMRREMPDALVGIDHYENWAAALLINAALAERLHLSAGAAPEAVLAHRFARRGKPVVGFETIRRQLGLFDSLPPQDQRLLLDQALADAAQAGPQFRALYADWADGNQAGIAAQALPPLATTPHLRAVLLDRRNQRWAYALDHLLRHNALTPFVAVGAAHLVGPDGLLARLEKLGWQVKRVA